MKKALVVILILVMTLCMFSCKKTNENYENGYEEIDLTEYVTLVDYSNFSYDAPVVTVTDEDIEKQITELLHSKLEKKYVEEGEVSEGDTITISFDGKLADGTTVSGMSSNSYEMELGVTSMIDGFTESIYGHKVGDEFDANCVFPDPYPNNTDLSGKEAIFTIKILNIVEEVVPELTEEWVKANTSSKSIEKLKELIKNDLEAEKLAEAQDSIKSDIYKKLIEGAVVVKMDEEKVQAEMTTLDTWFKNLAILEEMTWEEYIKEELEYESQEEYEAKLKEDAKTIVEYDLKVYAYAQKEEVQITQEQYDDLVNDMLKYYGISSKDDFLASAAITIDEYIHLTGYDLDLYANAFINKIYDKVVK